MQSAEPFIEAVGPVRDIVGASAYRVGYRVHGTGEVIAAIEIPAQIVEEAVTSKSVHFGHDVADRGTQRNVILLRCNV